MYKILIVEDDEVIAKTLKVHLEKWGYEAVCVQDFNHVMECFVKEQPSIVLMDIGLPFFNGYHWCTQIRNISQVPVIFLSSMSDNMNIVMAMNMGGDDFIIAFGHKRSRPAMGGSKCFSCCLFIVFFVVY